LRGCLLQVRCRPRSRGVLINLLLKMQVMVCYFSFLLWLGHGAIVQDKRMFLHAALQEDPPPLKCVGWKKTLNCDPSGPRDSANDKDCAKTVSSEESGWCECGDFTKLNDTAFGAVPCTHPPFTCDAMCLKFAVVSGMSIEYQGATLSSEEANKTLGGIQDNPFDLDLVKKYQHPPPIPQQMKEFSEKAAEKLTAHNEEVNKKAEVAQKEVEEVMKQNSRAWEDVHIMANNLRNPGGQPVWKALANSARQMQRAGKKIQDTVKNVLPWDALAGPPPFSSA